MPNKQTQKKKAKEAPKKLDKKVLSGIKKMANSYSVYEQRLALRATIDAQEKNKLLGEFINNYQDDISSLILGNDLDSHTTEQLKEKGLDETSIAFVRSFNAYIENDGKDFVKADKLGKSSNILETVREDVEDMGNKGATQYAEGQDVTTSADQEKGLRDIAKWLYKSSEDRTAARRGSNHLGNKSHSIFIEEILKKPAKQRLLIFYLVENDRTKSCTPDDIVKSQTYIPDVNVFKSKMKKAKITRLLAKESIKWSLLGDAIQQAGIAIGTTAIEVPEAESEEERESREAKSRQDLEILTKTPEEREEQEFLTSFNYDDSENETIRLEDPSLDDQLRLLPEISSRIRELVDSDPKLKGSKDLDKVKFEAGSNNEKEYAKLIYALGRIRANMTEYCNQKAQEDPSAHINEKLTDAKPVNTAIFKKMGDGLCKLPVTPLMSAGTAISALAIIIKVGGLIKNHKILSSGDLAERILGLTASCADLAANASKLGLITTAVNVGTAMGTASTVGGALGIVSGGLSMATASVNAGKADALKKGAKKAGEYLDSANKKADDFYDGTADKADLAMASDIQAYLKSMHHTKALAAGKDMIGGTLTAIGGALTLTGAGMVPGLIMMGLGLVTNLGGMAVGKIASYKEKKKTLNRFFKMDEIMDTLKKQNLIPDDKKVQSHVAKELRTYAEAKMGAANDDQAYKIIMSRYAHFLYMKTFLKGNGEYHTAADYEGKPQTAEDDIAFACKTMLSSMGVKLKFGATKDEAPKTTEEDVRRRMKL